VIGLPDIENRRTRELIGSPIATEVIGDSGTYPCVPVDSSLCATLKLKLLCEGQNLPNVLVPQSLVRPLCQLVRQMHQKMILEHHKVELAVEEVEEVLSLVIAVVHESLVVRRYLRGRCDDVRLAGPPREFHIFVSDTSVQMMGVHIFAICKVGAEDMGLACRVLRL